MFPLALALVMLSGIIHAVWNLFAKQSGSPLVFLWSLQWIGVVAFLPWALAATAGHTILIMGWAFLLGSVILYGVYVTWLARTYTVGDLSQVYPLMRGMSPLLVPVLGMTLLGERMSEVGGLGILAIILGIALLGDWPGAGRAGLDSRATRLALMVGLAITAYTVCDKMTLRYIPPVTLNDASNFGNLLALSWSALGSGAIRSEWARHWRTIILGGILSPGAYLLFLFALRMAPVAQLAPMREIGIVFGTLFGIGILNERQGARRLGAAGLILAGVITLGIWGT